MEVRVTSKESIKPSSPTPHHLKTYNLSLLDHFIPPHAPYAPVILFYSQRINPSHLKSSLSETLTNFYPLAGKIKDQLSIDCDDGGAFFVETRVNRSLSEFLSEPDLLELYKLLSWELSPKETYAGTYVTNIQFNLFECGGAAIGVCISHRILDGAGVGTFFRGWSAFACSGNPTVIPDFSAPSLFPANDLWLREPSMAFWGSLLRKGKSITKRFLFDSSAIKILKDSVPIKKPSRIEVVSAFIWERAMAASWKLNNGERRSSVLTHVVNLRKRIRPPMSENSLGNILWIAGAHCKKDDPDKSLGNLAAEVRKSIQKIDGHFVDHLKAEEMKRVMSDSLEETRGTWSEDEAVDRFTFSSWCKFGYYETDLGWGKPVWVSSVGIDAEVFMNVVVLADTPDGDGIEAWITLDETEMDVLEGDEEMGRCARLNPSPLSFARTCGTSG